LIDRHVDVPPLCYRMRLDFCLTTERVRQKVLGQFLEIEIRNFVGVGGQFWARAGRKEK